MLRINHPRQWRDLLRRDVKIWASFCLVLAAVLLMTLERQHKSCMRGSPHFILGHYDKSVAHCKNELLWVMPFLYEMWPLLLLWLWYLTNNNPTLILQKFPGWSHHNSQVLFLNSKISTKKIVVSWIYTLPRDKSYTKQSRYIFQELLDSTLSIFTF